MAVGGSRLSLLHELRLWAEQRQCFMGVGCLLACPPFIQALRWFYMAQLLTWGVGGEGLCNTTEIRDAKASHQDL